jgi:RNA polymerase sigma-32 factor
VDAELVGDDVTEALEGDAALDGGEVTSKERVIDAGGTAITARVGARLPENLTALNVYLARLKDVEILPVEEQAELALKFQADGDAEAAARLVASNLRLVVKIAFQFRRQWADVMDLIAEGNVGLAEAIRKFDADKGVPFPSYARFWIRARILAFIQENKHMIHAGSRAARKLFWRLERERRQLIQEGHDPTPKRLADRVGVKPEDVIELAPIIEHRPISLDAPVGGEEDGRSRGDLLSDEFGVTPEGAAASGQMQALLQEAFKAFRETLDTRDQSIWDQRLQALEPVRLEDLGGEFGVSKERVRQLEMKIKARLKVYLKRRLGEDIIVEALR